MILRNDGDEMSLSVLDEIHLLVYLCSSIFPSVPKSELVSESTILHESSYLHLFSKGSGSGGYGGVHAAILSLAARFVGTNQWSHKFRAENPWTPGFGFPTQHSDRTDVVLMFR
jgi:nuclear pore complex protein Nup205